MILNQAQAEAVYTAMCALNNVGCEVFNVRMPATNGMAVSVHQGQGIVVKLLALQVDGPEQVEDAERYTNQSGFATTYGLNKADEFNPEFLGAQRPRAGEDY